MPRISAEARAASAYRAGVKAPEPPKHLSKEARDVWTAIVASKPVEWFDPGAQILLESYCELAVQARGVHRRLERLRKSNSWDDAKPWEKRAGLLSEKLTTLATKLRLSVQSSVDRKSRMLDEKPPAEPAADPLIGGAAVWGDRPLN